MKKRSKYYDKTEPIYAAAPLAPANVIPFREASGPVQLAHVGDFKACGNWTFQIPTGSGPSYSQRTASGGVVRDLAPARY